MNFLDVFSVVSFFSFYKKLPTTIFRVWTQDHNHYQIRESKPLQLGFGFIVSLHPLPNLRIETLATLFWFHSFIVPITQFENRTPCNSIWFHSFTALLESG